MANTERSVESKKSTLMGKTKPELLAIGKALQLRVDPVEKKEVLVNLIVEKQLYFINTVGRIIQGEY